MYRSLLMILVCFWVVACNPPRKAKPVYKPGPPDIPVSHKANNVAWQNSERLMPVLEKAQRENKPVFVEFYASWCAPCKVMEEDIFTQKEVSRYLNSNFLNFHTDFDSESGKTIASIYEVSKLPTVLFLDPQGVVLEQHVGIANPSVLTALGNSALQKMGK